MVENVRQFFQDLLDVVQTSFNTTRDSLVARQPSNGTPEGLIICIVGFVVATCIVNCLSGLFKTLWTVPKTRSPFFEENDSSNEGIVLDRSKDEKKKKKKTTDTSRTNVSMSCSAGFCANNTTPKRNNGCRKSRHSSDDDEEVEKLRSRHIPTAHTTSSDTATNSTTTTTTTTTNAAAVASLIIPTYAYLFSVRTQRASSVFRELNEVIKRFATEEDNMDHDIANAVTATNYRPGEDMSTIQEESGSKTQTASNTEIYKSPCRFDSDPKLFVCGFSCHHQKTFLQIMVALIEIIIK